MEKVYRHNKWGNTIKREYVNGLPVYHVYSCKDGSLIADIAFGDIHSEHGTLTNSDLLEIVKDRLHAHNGAKFATHKTKVAEDRVTEALMWSDDSAMRRSMILEDKAKAEQPDEGQEV